MPRKIRKAMEIGTKYACCVRQAKRNFKSFVVRFVVATTLVFSSHSHAQTDAQLKQAVLQSVVSMLLSGGALSISLTPESVSQGSFGFQYGDGDADEKFTIEFEGANDDLVLCLNGIDIQAGEIVLELNGASIGNLESGEFCITLPTGGGAGQQSTGENILELIHSSPGDRWGITNISLRYPRVLGLTRVLRDQWDEGAVRKVLKVFAFGGHPTNAQVTAWANMDPTAAIQQILNFSRHNSQLSPLAVGETYTDPATGVGTFDAFSRYLGSNSSNLPMDLDTSNNNYSRGRFAPDSYDREGAFFRMATTRGLNPFRQRIGMWETNYHLATNLDTSVDHYQMIRYYDDIMNAHESGMAYQDVLAVASKSAAVAMQYGHRRNRWINEECLCNDDFAREIHQLFFGILGELDPQSTASYNHHEEVTIPQTARMLTDMKVDYDNQMERFPDYVTFGTSQHHTEPLYILNTQISGANAAEKIDNLVDISIEHPESLASLPIIIISGLADDNLDEEDKTALRAAWAAMGDNKNLLEFIRAYAVSDLFHSSTQRKYMTSFERGIYQANRLYLSNTESLQDRMGIDNQFRDENVELFRPTHNVFGGQTSLEAANSATIFESNYNRSTEDYNYRYRGVFCDDCNFGQAWEKDWASVIPRTNGSFVVGDVARWLWIYVVGNDDDYTALEEAHLVTLLGAAERKSNPNDQYHQNLDFDLSHLLCIRQEMVDASAPDISLNRILLSGWHQYCMPDDNVYSGSELTLLQRAYSRSEIENTDYIQQIITELKQSEIPLDENPAFNQRRYANRRVQSALSFIFSTPYVFVEERR